MRELVAAILESCGYRCSRPPDGSEALAIAGGHAGPIDLLVTDVVMPGMSGRELAETWSPRDPRLRVLYMSGYTDDVIAYRGVLESGILLLDKPFTTLGILDQRTRGPRTTRHGGERMSGPQVLERLPTGISGLDELSAGACRARRTTSWSVTPEPARPSSRFQASRRAVTGWERQASS